MTSEEPSKKRIAVIGGGISGLIAAKKLADQGYQVDIFESDKRLGGKIQTITKGNTTADLAAEFIDSKQKSVQKMAEELGVPLEKAMPDASSNFKLSDGRVLNETQFNDAYRPVSALILADKEFVTKNPNSARAQELDGMSMSDYLDGLKQRADEKASSERPLWKKMLFIPATKVDAAVVNAAKQGFAAEFGNPAKELSALGLVYASGDTENWLHSDCDKRIVGGTQALTDALAKDLESKGAHFNTGYEATKIDKTDGKFDIGFKDKENAGNYDQVVMATSAHALANIEGLDAVGLSSEAQAKLKNMQYVNWEKVTVSTNKGAYNPREAGEGFFISDMGYQTWTRPTGEVVFLIGDDLAKKHSAKDVMDMVLEDYAKAHGTTGDVLFNKQDAVVQKQQCTVARGIGQTIPSQELSQTYDQMEKNGVGVVGTYVVGADNNAGYMDSGAESAGRAAGIMVNTDIARARALEQSIQMQLASEQGPLPPNKPQGRFI